MPRSRTAQVAAVAALAVAVGAFLAVAAVRHGFFDLRVYHGAVTFWAREGGELYDYLKPDSRYGFTYPPFAALVMLPLAVLPWHAAIVLSVLGTGAATAAVLRWLGAPLVRRAGWPPWFALSCALLLAAAFEPMRETVNFGQVNALLLAVVAADLLFGVARGRPWAGAAIGLATAVKLTPGIFVLYLLVTGRWRAAATAVGAAAAATVVAGAVAPDASREFWTQALWNTDRVGDVSFVSNQSLLGVVARVTPAAAVAALWAVLVGAALLWWGWRARRAVAAGDEAAGLALTGVVGCLISPVTWVHHLVWLLPALLLVVDGALARPAGGRRRTLLGFAALAYAVLCSRLIWLWQDGAGGAVAFVGANAYVWLSVALFALVPIRGGPGRPDAAGGRVDRQPPRSSMMDPALS
ncbi:MAG TPA: glycosyltransferase 87 family protein [Pilimelia sp.]|nr:glycosyltransferase 87 family protein [Pilimelia sp.]